MNIVFLSHSDLLGSQSMPRFRDMLANGMQMRGHRVTILKPREVLSRIPAPFIVRKWLGYIDQYILFSAIIRKKVKHFSSDTLFVLTDHALGIWASLVTHRPHVIHCHDFLAQQSAAGGRAYQTVGWTGRQYQAMIRRGYSTGKNFISVSQKTKADLHAFLSTPPQRSEVVYNGFNNAFGPRQQEGARAVLASATRRSLREGYILHVGGNQWYKNRRGVIEIYDAWREFALHPLPLVMIGKPPDRELRCAYERSRYRQDIQWVENAVDSLLVNAYAGASVLLFPSLAEGFGWPIVEAMACGCPVITTGLAPMTEVAGGAAFLIPPRPHDDTEVASWASQAAASLNSVISLSTEAHAAVVRKGLENAKRFNTAEILDKVEAIYLEITGRPKQSEALEYNAAKEAY